MNSSKSKQSRWWTKWHDAGSTGRKKLKRRYTWMDTQRRVDALNMLVYGTSDVMHVYGVGTVRGDDRRFADGM
jgi:hypothetical protein